MTDKKCAGEWFAEWMASRCPVKLPQREFGKVARHFLKGHLVIVHSTPITLDLGKVEIWVG